MEAAMMPLPSEEATPPVTKMYFVSDTFVACLVRVPDVSARKVSIF